MKINVKEILKEIFISEVSLIKNYAIIEDQSEFQNQTQTNDIFSDKWLKMDDRKGLSSMERFQLDWYLKLYGFKDEQDLSEFLKSKKVVLDAGCGLGYKAAWFAKLSPETLVIGMDFSEAAIRAANNYSDIENLIFIRGDISATGTKKNSLDYISCDQVIHHTENPDQTFKHLSERLKKYGEFACYVYAKKALPRELLDDYFREYSKKVTKEELWDLSEQLTQLGKDLSALKVNINVPDMPLLNIKGGEYDIQRFIYWNFLKCFWNDEFGFQTSKETNFDWYAPSNAKRYDEKEFKQLIENNQLDIEFFHKEEACYSGRFRNST